MLSHYPEGSMSRNATTSLRASIPVRIGSHALTVICVALLGACFLAPTTVRAQVQVVDDIDSGSTSLQIVDGFPAFSYYDDEEGGELWFAMNDQANGLGSWSSLLVDANGDGVGYANSLQIVGGVPAISYLVYENDGYALRFAINDQADGSGQWAVGLVDGDNGGGSTISLMIVDGRPAISYYGHTDLGNDESNYPLKFAINESPDGTGEWVIHTVDPSYDAGTYTSLQVVDGRPAMSYSKYDPVEGEYHLLYAINESADATGEWDIYLIDEGDNDSDYEPGDYNSLQIVDGRPAISYYVEDDGDGELHFAISDLADGSGEWNTDRVYDDADSDDVGQHTSLQVVGGFPAISYYDAENRDLRYAVNDQVDGLGDWADYLIDGRAEDDDCDECKAASKSASDPTVGRYSSLLTVAGRPAISYEGDGDLRFWRQDDIDYGDARDDSDYPVLRRDDGASHGNTDSATLYLGTTAPDSELDGQPSSDAGFDGTDGDDGSGTADEEGLIFPPLVVAADGGDPTIGTIGVTTYGRGYLNIWIDFEDNRNWYDEPDFVVVDYLMGISSTSVTEYISFEIPTYASVGDTYLRARFCSEEGECDSQYGSAEDGEVEDYQITFLDGNGYTPVINLEELTFDTVRTDGDDTCFVDTVPDPEVTLFCIPSDNLNAPVITGTDGNDNLTLDLSDGNPFPNGVTFNGGSQSGDPGDMITLIGAGITTVNYDFATADSGTIDVDGTRITYTGLEPIIDNTDAANRVFTCSGVADDITLSDDGTPDDDISFFDCGGAGESVAFVNPTASLTINGGAGDDTLDIGLLDKDVTGEYPYIAVIVNGDADEDTFNVTAEPTLALSPTDNYFSFTVNGGAPAICTGDVLNVTGGTIAAPSGFTPPGGTVTFTPPGSYQDIVYATMEALGFVVVDLAVTSGTFDDDPAYPGDDITLTVSVTNDAAPKETAYCVRVDLSAFSNVLNASPPLPVVASAGTFDTSTFVWTLPTLAPGATQTLDLTFVVDTQLSGDFTSDITVGNNNADDDAGNDSFTVPLTVGTVFKFPAKAHAQSAVFKTSVASGLERMILGLYGGSPGINGAVWCRVPEPDALVFTVVGMPTVYKTCSEGLPNNAGVSLPLYVNDLWLDETGAGAGRIYMTTWGSQGLYYSDDDGESWTAFEPNLSDGFGGSAGWVNVYAITEDATDGIFYISANNGLVFRSLNSGTTWQQVSSLPEGAADTPWSLISHPTTPGTLFAGTLGKGVYVSTDYGLSWGTTADNATLVAARAGYIFDLEIRESGDFDYLFAATSQGIWRTDYAAGIAATWTEIDTNQGNITPSGANPEIRSITFGEDVDMDGEPDLYAVSWGFGVLRNATPYAAPLNGLVQFALRGADVTMFAVAPSGTLHIGTTDGAVYEMDPRSPVGGVVTSAEADFDSDVIPDGFVLEQNYPNPFNPQTSIRFAVPETGNVRLVVVDMLGRTVSVLADGPMQAGTHDVVFDATDLPSGTYLYRMEATGVAITRLLSLVK
jgi:Domain of unknown function DUF11/GEVED domain